MIKDSGNRTEFKSGAVRDIQEGKGRCDLLPLDIIDLWCDDGLQGTLYYVGKYLKCKDNTDYFELILNQFAEEHQAKRIAAGENVNNKLYSLEEYRWNLVLELAKHFEEGAKKYGDRNWEKGIPCDRYIDSAVRHYCKWRAEWDDEPHDRAFIWNVVCCEWTRQQYGWNLEKIQPSPEEEAYVNHDKAVTDSSAYDFSLASNRSLKKWENILGVKHSLLDVPWACDESKSESKKFLEIGEQFSEAIGDSMDAITKHLSESLLTIHIKKEEIKNEDILEQIKDQEFSDLKAACNVVERHNYCFTSPTEFCCARACKECEYYQDAEVIHKAVNHLLDHTKKSLKDGEKANNRYARNVTGGVELYDYAGNYVGYVHGFMVSEEGETDIRSIVQNSWGLLTFNPHTLEKIIEDHGYISDFQFLVELYKNPSDIKLPEQWYLMKRKAKESSK